MKRWSLLAVGVLAVVGCHASPSDGRNDNDDKSGAAPVDETNLTGATVTRAPITPPPPVDDSVVGGSSSYPADRSTMIPQEPVAPATAAPLPPATEDTPPVELRPRRLPPRSTSTETSSFPETSFGSGNTERATGGSFPETSFGDYNTPASGSMSSFASADAGAAPYSVNVPR